MKYLSGLAVMAGVAGVWLWPDPRPLQALPETVHIAAGPQDYRPAGEFRRGNRVVDAPLDRLHVAALEIMKYQVSEAEYALCVADNACPPTASDGRPDFAQTNINHADATAYALWFSDRSGVTWRLPTDAEWLRAAAERGMNDGFAADANGADPSRRWIASYLREVRLRGEADLQAHPLGYFGVNSAGVADVAGNVWEWTDTCFQNGTLSADGTAIATQSDYCGVRAVQGKHRAFVIEFIRDARSGGCAAGVPPDYLGFRLVRRAAGPFGAMPPFAVLGELA
jgi:formylglycine-generating enzyme required for sulfatase activity